MRKTEEVDDGQVNFIENQQLRTFEDHAALAFPNNIGKHLTSDDVGPSCASSPQKSVTASGKPSAKEKPAKKAEVAEEPTDDSDEDLSPWEKAAMMQSDEEIAKPKAKGKGKAKPK